MDCVCDPLDRVQPGVYNRLLCATCTAMPVDDSSVDAIVAGEFIEHLSEGDVDHTLQEFARVLQPGGQLLISTPDLGYWRVRLTGPSVVGGVHLSQHPANTLAVRLRLHGLGDVSLTGSGRWPRQLGQRFPVPAGYGSYLITARNK